MKIVLNPDKELVNEINIGLEENKRLYGKAYCPCSILRNENTICMCKEFREQKIGSCHCGKYIKIDKQEM